METIKPNRYHYIDWLRVLAVATVIIYHSARSFDTIDWHVKNNHLYFGMTVFTRFIAQWMMPLFFVISGASITFALEQSGGSKFIWKRFKRLVIPLLFGMFVLIAPLQVWIERVSEGQFTGSFLEFYPHYFDGAYGFGGNFAWMGLHLWYLEFLFIYTLIFLPLFLLFKKPLMLRIASKIADKAFKVPLLIFSLALPIILFELLVNQQPYGIGMRRMGGWSILTYISFLFTGYFIASDQKFIKVIEKIKFPALIFGIICIPFVLNFEILNEPAVSFLYFIRFFLRSFNAFSWIIVILGFGYRYLNFKNSILEYTNEAVLPGYALHQTVIVVIAFSIINWDISIAVKYPIVLISSFIIIATLYELIIRRFNLIRLIFGLKIKSKAYDVKNSPTSQKKHTKTPNTSY